MHETVRTLITAACLLAITAAAPALAGEADLTTAERQLAVAALADSQSEFEELVADVTETTWAQKPAPEKWSVGEVAEHILLSEETLFGMLEQTLAGEPNPDWRSATAGKMEKIHGFMPNRTVKADAPGPLQPSGELGRAETLERLAAARARTIALARTTRKAVKAHTAPHPAEFFGELNVHQWLEFIAAHHRRHNAQIAEAKAWLAAAPPGARAQIAGALAALPEVYRDGAEVRGYDTGGELITLREGVNELTCLADLPGDDRFHAACYHVALEDYMARGRELRAEGVEGPDTLEIRHREADAGELEMPRTAATIYNLGGPLSVFDPETGAVSGAHWVWSIYIPYATEADTGLPTTPQAPGAPWIMRPGTASSHIMVVQPREPAPAAEPEAGGSG